MAALGCDDEGGGGQAPGDAEVADAVVEVDAACAPGTPDCPCLRDGTCRLPALTCSAGYCRDLTAPCDPDVERCPPAEPVCYTPCRGDYLTDEGAVLPCLPDGLIRGCLPGSACHLGSCTPITPITAQTMDPGVCEHGAECPDFQVCLRGRCYSECEQTAECADLPGNPRVCDRRVCREQCGAGEPCTDPQHFCDTGVCQPLVPADPDPTPPPTGAFDVDAERLAFTASYTDRTIRLTNRGAGPLVLTVRKAEQLTLGADGTPERITDAPLPWLTLDGERVEQIEVVIPDGGEATVALGGAADHAFARWSGRLEITGPGLPIRAVRLVYSSGLAGRWSGTAYAFGNFGGHTEIEAWMRDRTNTEPAIPNAFMRVWAQYRNGGVPLDEMGAIVQATITGSWDDDRVRALCRDAGNLDAAVCAPFDNADGVIAYTSNAEDNPVPSGVIQSALSIDLTEADCPAPGGVCGVGRIDSAVALQYPGDPRVDLRFGGPPEGCERDDAVQGCVTTLTRFDAELVIGGRAPGACVGAQLEVTAPWLVDGFWPRGGDDIERVECRDTGGPYAEASRNARFAEANPIPDGQPRRRRLSLVDGLLVEQNVLVLLLRETVDPFHGEGAPLVSYQYVVLTREAVDEAELDPVGNAPGPVATLPGEHGPACDPALLREVSGVDTVAGLDPASSRELATVLLTGATGDFAPLDGLEPHSLCIWDEQVGNVGALDVDDDGRLVDDVTADNAVPPGMVRRAVIDAGPDPDGPIGNRPCFPGAEIIYFAVPPGTAPHNWACNQTFQAEDCLTELRTVVAKGELEIAIEASARARFRADEIGEAATFDLVTRCTDGEPTCDDDRFDLVAGKTFARVDGASVFFAPLDEVVARAFRYKTRFVDRAGTSLGFSPSVCRGDVRPDPYCFDPVALDDARRRIDCLLVLQRSLARDAITPGLQRVFGAIGPDPDDPILGRGFEDLYAELLIMQGDEALTAAYDTRYAVGTARAEPFEGALFELDGANLSGIAGTEMANLHRAAQTYELVLGRFFSLVPTLWANAVEPNVDDRFVTERTVTGWMDRVIRASTQRARVYSEIARRYQSLGRPGLATTVIRRAYVRAHQEGLVLTALIDAIADRVDAARRDGIRQSVAQAQVRYRVALLEMADRHTQVLSGADLFGFPRGYVPFPALDEDAINGFEEMLDRALDRLDLAAADEERAIAERREYDSDEAAFRAELVTQRNTYEAELGALCGTFVDAEGRVWPAIARYAHRIPADEGVTGDPCGRLGNGELWLKASDIQTRELELTRVRQEAQNALAGMRDTFDSVEAECALIEQDAATFLQEQQVIAAIEGGIDGMELSISILDKTLDFISEATALAIEIDNEQTPYAIVTDSIASGAWTVAAGVHLAATTTLESTILTSKAEIRAKERLYEEWQIRRECAYLRTERPYLIREQEREFLLTKLDVLNAVWNVDVELSLLRSLLNERARLEAEWDDAEQLAVDAASAQADPTKRIYKNDAIRNAEQSFDVALRAAWQATLTYEYFTGQSYPQREALFLARLVDRGDVNLRRYLEDLREDYYDFEQSYGNPDTRVARISICDDVFDIERISPAGEIRDAAWRTARCREMLKDPARLDATGALRIPFSTDFAGLSPRTQNHKILFVEIGLHGELGGDGVARVYLEADGTGVVTGTDGQRRFYTFPPRTAVMNPFFSGEDGRAFGQDADGAITGPTRSIYRSYRFRERPFVQSSWALVLDQRAEQVNRDIDLGALTDIVIDVFYTDFTRDAL